MKFKNLSLKNIRSYESADISFSDGAVLLSGDIGSGKTSILQAIEYSLFGLQPGQKGSSLLRNNSDSGEVILDFEIDGAEIKIERKLKRTSKTVANDYAAITVDGERVESSITEIKTKILSLLGYPSEFIKKNNLLYRYTVYTPQEQMKEIILEDPEIRLNILRHVFGIDKYRQIRENTSVLLNNMKEELKILQGETKYLDDDRTRILAKKEHILSLEKILGEKALLLESNKAKRKLIEKEIAELGNEIKEKERFEKEIEKTNILVSTKRENLNLLNKELEELKIYLSQAKDTFLEADYKNILSKMQEKKEAIEKISSLKISSLASINSLQKTKEETLEKRQRLFQIDICPTCLQDVPEAHKHNIMNETENSVSEINKQILNLEAETKKISSSLEAERISLDYLESEKSRMEILKSKIEYLEKSKSKILQMEQQKISMERDISLLEKHIFSLKEQALAFSKFDNLSNIRNAELKLSFMQEKNSEISLAETKKEFELTKAEILDLEIRLVDKEKALKRISNLTELSDWLSNKFLALIEFTERNVLVNIRSEFSEIFNKWFQILVPADSFEVHIDESFTPLMIKDETEMDYAFLSGGERTAVALAYRLALNQTINSLLSKIKTRDIVILDEPTDGFSDTQLQRMKYVLKELNARQLIIVSHEQKIEEFADSMIKVRKDAGQSHIVEEDVKI